MDELDKRISSILKEDIELPNKYHNAIQKALYRNTKIKNKNTIIKFVLALSSSAILTTGVVFATGITKYINEFFNSNKGIDTAIENGYILNTDTSCIDSSDIQIKVDNVLMDDFNLSMSFSIIFNNDTNVEEIEKINFSDMIITDEDKRIIYCENKEKFNKYCLDNELNYTYLDFNDNYINCGSNYYIKSKKDNVVEVIYNFYSSQYPRSKKLNININNIKLEQSNKDILSEGDWNIELDMPEKFYKREAKIYSVKNCSDPSIDIKELAIYNTCTKFEFNTKLNPIYNDNDTEETKESKKEEFIKWGMSLPYSFIENEYIELSNGEKFYPTESSSEDSGTSYPFNGEMNHFQTFNLTQYDNLTENIRLYFTLHTQKETKEIMIEFERK